MPLQEGSVDAMYALHACDMTPPYVEKMMLGGLLEFVMFRRIDDVRRTRWARDIERTL